MAVDGGGVGSVSPPPSCQDAALGTPGTSPGVGGAVRGGGSQTHSTGFASAIALAGPGPQSGFQSCCGPWPWSTEGFSAS